jgi:acyl-CoA reductase-like NAD-dependent aldehyde dehydrogenase
MMGRSRTNNSLTILDTEEFRKALGTAQRDKFKRQLADMMASAERIACIIRKEVGEPVSEDHVLYQSLVRPFHDAAEALLQSVTKIYQDHVRREKVRSYGTRKRGAAVRQSSTPPSQAAG